MKLNLVGILAVIACFISSCRGCTEQHDPTGDWKKFEKEQKVGNAPVQKLKSDGSLPDVAEVEDKVEVTGIAAKYGQFCGSCHGAAGAADGAAAAAMNPKPRNFTTWKDSSITDEYIAKVIKEGGAAVGKSASMAPWGALLSDDEVNEMVGLIREFAK